MLGRVLGKLGVLAGVLVRLRRGGLSLERNEDEFSQHSSQHPPQLFSGIPLFLYSVAGRPDQKLEIQSWHCEYACLVFCRKIDFGLTRKIGKKSPKNRKNGPRDSIVYIVNASDRTLCPDLKSQGFEGDSC